VTRRGEIPDPLEPFSYDDLGRVVVLVVLVILAIAGVKALQADAAEGHAYPKGMCWRIHSEHPVRLERCRAFVKRHAAKHRAERREARFRGMHAASASWYGPGFYGRRTACGKTHTTSSWHVAALHPHLAKCGLRLRVCSTSTRCVHVRVQDRGAWRSDDRALDLAPRVKAALKCGDVCRVRWSRP
jgi:hypothetical protein